MSFSVRQKEVHILFPEPTKFTRYKPEGIKSAAQEGPTSLLLLRLSKPSRLQRKIRIFNSWNKRQCPCMVTSPTSNAPATLTPARLLLSERSPKIAVGSMCSVAVTVMGTWRELKVQPKRPHVSFKHFYRICESSQNKYFGVVVWCVLQSVSLSFKISSKQVEVFVGFNLHSQNWIHKRATKVSQSKCSMEQSYARRNAQNIDSHNILTQVYDREFFSFGRANP